MKRGNRASTFRVMAHDPSFTAWGWAVLDLHGNVIRNAAIKTEPAGKKLRIRKGDDRVRRILELSQTLIEIIQEEQVGLMLCELPHGSQNASAAVMIGATAAIVQTIGVALNIPVEWYSEADAKGAVLGKKSAKKQEMIDAICKLYPTVRTTGVKWKDEAVADALAIHYVATKKSEILKFLRG